MINRDEVLRIVAGAVDLSPTNRLRAEAAYPHIGDWLSRPDSPLASLNPRVFPQGSVKLGTVNNPYGAVEFDVDAVAQIAVGPGVSATAARKLVGARLEKHPEFRSRIEHLAKCHRIHYANGFHVDVITATPYRSALRIATVGGWISSNPDGFARWFEQRSSQSEAQMAKAYVEPLPVTEETYSKSPLKLAVQLFKRARDVYYDNDPDSPASMLITTIAGLRFTGSPNLLDGMWTIVTGLRELLRVALAPFLENPSNPGENLARGLAGPETRERTHEFLDAVSRRLDDFQSAAGLPDIHSALSALFGPGPANTVSETVGTMLSAARTSGSLKFSPTIGLGSEGVPVLAHTFHHGGRGEA